MTNDLINGLFEFGGAIAGSMSIRALLKDRCYSGYSPWNLVFFNGWGIFNLYYYPSLEQHWSFLGGCALASMNTIQLFLLWWFPHRPLTEAVGETG